MNLYFIKYTLCKNKKYSLMCTYHSLTNESKFKDGEYNRTIYFEY